MRGRSWLSAAGAGAVFLSLAGTAEITSAASSERVFRGGRVLSAAPGKTPIESQVLREKRARGYLVRDAAGHAAGKAAANAASSRLGGSSVGGGTVSTNALGESFEGLVDTGVAPPQSHGAIGTTRFVQLVNSKYGIYDRSGGLIESGTLASLTGIAGTFLFDVQVIWDPDTSRFYYAMNDVEAGGNYLAFGFSKTDTPNGAADFCQYKADFGYGTDLADYPKLGTTTDFLVIGVNAFDSNAEYLGSDILTISKPPSGSSCPAAGSFVLNAQLSVENENATLAWTPVPAVQTDPLVNGWVVSVTELATDDELTVFKVMTGAGGGSVIEQRGRRAASGGYTVPPDAPQAGTTKLLDTLDGRLTQAVAAVCPSHSDQPGIPAPQLIWTQHTIDEPSVPTGRAMVRWYRINPTPAPGDNLSAAGFDVKHPSLHVFNGAIAPDRRVNGTARAFGCGIAWTFNTSSATTFPALQAQQWQLYNGDDLDQTWINIRQSTGFNQDFTCDMPAEPVCRWGDYASATPDPAADPGRMHGVVWFSSQWNAPSSTPAGSDWRTQNGSIGIEPAPFGLLRVTTSPPVPSQIHVDNGPWDSWGLTWAKQLVGQYTISFTDVEGYTTPPSQVMNVTEGNTTTVTGTFQRRGLLRVITSPALPATIRVDGFARNDWGLWTWLPTGAHQVCFGAVAEWLPPACQNVTLLPGEQSTVTGSYVASPGAPPEPAPHGFLRVTTSPPVPSQISINGNIADNWGLTWVKVPPGQYTIAFSDVEGYATPDDRVVTVNAGQTTEATGEFRQLALLRVITDPPVPATVDGPNTTRNDWGLWTWVEPGPLLGRQVCFRNAPGFTAGQCQWVNLPAGSQATVTGTYTPNG